MKCGWGGWSLVDASLEAVKAAVEAFPRATHFYMLSGDCMPIKSAEYAHDFWIAPMWIISKASISSPRTGSRPGSRPKG
ncbi:beta-1,6-N-acetylglucosaminyltransferase [Gemmobacter lanyuensis]